MKNKFKTWLNNHWQHAEPTQPTDMFGNPVSENKIEYERLAKQFRDKTSKLTLKGLYQPQGLHQLSDNLDAFYQQYPEIQHINQMLKTSIDKRGPLTPEMKLPKSGELRHQLKALDIKQPAEHAYWNNIMAYFNIINSLQMGQKLYQPIMQVLETQANKMEAYQANQKAKIKWLRKKALPKLMKKLDVVIDSQFATDNYVIYGYHQRYTEFVALDDAKLVDALFSIGVRDCLKHTLFPKLDFLRPAPENQRDTNVRMNLVQALISRYELQPDLLNLMALMNIFSWTEIYIGEVYHTTLKALKGLTIEHTVLKKYVNQRIDDIENIENSYELDNIAHQLRNSMDEAYAVGYDVGILQCHGYSNLILELNQILAGLIMERPMVDNRYINQNHFVIRNEA